MTVAFPAFDEANNAMGEDGSLSGQFFFLPTGISAACLVPEPIHKLGKAGQAISPRMKILPQLGCVGVEGNTALCCLEIIHLG